jgi:hypothetical protein
MNIEEEAIKLYKEIRAIYEMQGIEAADKYYEDFGEHYVSTYNKSLRQNTETIEFWRQEVYDLIFKWHEDDIRHLEFLKDYI